MINISKQIIAAWESSSTRFALPEAEILPLGDTAQEKKKLEKVTHKYTTIREYDNLPLPGFTLYKANKKNFGSLESTWLVIDPRGFLSRITSENLENILTVTGITEGLIQEKCIWARENSQTKMVLVPVSSNLYADSVKNTKMIEEKVSASDVCIGDTVLLQNKLQGTYLGKLSLYSTLQETDNNTTKPVVHLRRQIVEISPGKFFYNTDCKILKIINHTSSPLTKEDAAEYINDKIKSGSASFSNIEKFYQYSTASVIKIVSPTAVAKPLISLEEIDRTEAVTLLDASINNLDHGSLLLENSKGKFLLEFPYFTIFATGMTNSPVYFTTRIKDDFSSTTDSISFLEKRRTGLANKVSDSLDNYTKFYKILKHVGNKNYI